MRGELEALASGMRSIGVDLSVIGWKAPRLSLPNWLSVDFVNPQLEVIINALPPRLGVRLMEFQVYRKAFIAGRRRKHAVVIGLTASGPFGPALAALSLLKIPPTILNTYHLGPSLQKKRSLWRLAFKILARKDIAFSAYSETIASQLRQLLTNYEQMISCLPEVIADAPAAIPSKRAGLNEVLLISGLDSIGRREPIKHLLGMDGIPFKKVVLHDPSGYFTGCDELQSKFGTSVLFERVSTYFTTDFAAFLKKASAVLVAYDPSFINPSSILRHLLAAGVPAISSRFPDSDFLVNKFGQIGELWDFDDIASLSAAMNRFINWSESDFAMHSAAGRDLCTWASPAASASAHLDFAMHISAIAERSNG